MVFTWFLKRQFFDSLKFLMALLGSSWSFLGRPGPKNAKMEIQIGSEKWPKMGIENVENRFIKSFPPKMANLCLLSGSEKWPKMDPKCASKLVQHLLIFGSNFGSLFLGVLELFGCLLGAFLGLLRLSWEASGPQKHQKIEGFLRFLKMQLFGSLELLMALLGSSCPLLGPIWSQNGSKMGSKSGPKSYQKNIQEIIPKMTKQVQILTPK